MAFNFEAAIAAVQQAATTVEWLPPVAPTIAPREARTAPAKAVEAPVQPVAPTVALTAVQKLARNTMNGLGNGRKLS